jgi:CheY-like chemotaxis protein
MRLWSNSARNTFVRKSRTKSRLNILQGNKEGGDEKAREMIGMTSTAPAGRHRGSPARNRPRSRGDKTVATSSAALVLVLDDDTSVCRSLRRLLSANGFQVRTFEKPSELLASDIPKSNACMVVDINLPEMNGVQMCETLKRSGRALPTVLITARNDAGVRSLATGFDAVAILFKPFDVEALLEAIRRALALSIRGTR